MFTFLWYTFFLCWGSYLNSVGYRLLYPNTFSQLRSFCPKCKYQIKWYDNLPIISWFLLKAECRNCKESISWLYPFIELLTLLSMVALWQTTSIKYFFPYFLFFSALIITIRTDFHKMLISRFVTTYTIPAVFIAAYFDIIPTNLAESIFGALFGYTILWITNKLSLQILKKEGIGQGDLELLACIGAWTGPIGCWIALTIGSILATIITLIYMLITKNKVEKIPLGAYLCFAAILFVIFQKYLIFLFIFN
ncbi:MAG: prepilin peptidase [Candidatus Chromulinivorax sp.]